jgi:hypothetical protein
MAGSLDLGKAPLAIINNARLASRFRPEVIRMRYILVLHDLLDADLGDLEPEEVDECDRFMSDVAGLVLCEDSKAVEEGIRKADRDQVEWRLFEVVGSSAEPRTVCFESNGRTVRSIQ